MLLEASLLAKMLPIACFSSVLELAAAGLPKTNREEPPLDAAAASAGFSATAVASFAAPGLASGAPKTKRELEGVAASAAGAAADSFAGAAATEDALDAVLPNTNNEEASAGGGAAGGKADPKSDEPEEAGPNSDAEPEEAPPELTAAGPKMDVELEEPPPPLVSPEAEPKMEARPPDEAAELKIDPMLDEPPLDEDAAAPKMDPEAGGARALLLDAVFSSPGSYALSLKHSPSPSSPASSSSERVAHITFGSKS